MKTVYKTEPSENKINKREESEMKAKKVLAAVMAATLAFSMAGCGSSSSSDSKSDSSSKAASNASNTNPSTGVAGGAFALALLSGAAVVMAKKKK